MGTQIAYGNVAGVIDVATVRSIGSVYTLPNAVIANKLFTANINTSAAGYKAYAFGNGVAGIGGANLYTATTAYISTTTGNVTVNLLKIPNLFFANSQLKAANTIVVGGATDSANLLAQTAFSTFSNITYTAAKFIQYTNNVSGNVHANIGLGAFVANTSGVDFAGNLLIGTNMYANSFVTSPKFIQYTNNVSGNVHANIGLGAFVANTSGVDILGRLNVSLGQYFLSNAIYLVSHTTGFTGLAGSGSGGGGGGLTGKVESWT